MSNPSAQTPQKGGRARDPTQDFEWQNPQIVLTRVQDFSLETLGGSESKKQLRCKGHETLGLLRYVSSRMGSWKQSLEEGETWCKAATHLMSIWTCLEDADAVVPSKSAAGLPLWVFFGWDGFEIRVGKVLHSVNRGGNGRSVVFPNPGSGS